MISDNRLNQWVRDVYAQRRKKNDAYSLRSFARSCRVPPSLMSEILNDKRRVTSRTLLRLSLGLGLSGKELESMTSIALPFLLNEDDFRLINDWYHLAILCLFELSPPIKTPKKAAKILGIDIFESQAAFDRLTRLNLLVLNQSKGAYSLAPEIEIQTSDETMSVAIQGFHQQMLEKARTALQEFPIDERDFLSSTIAISKEKIPELKKAMRVFRDSLEKIAQDAPLKDGVISLNLNFFPLLQRGKSHDPRH